MEASDFRNGVTFVCDGQPCQVIEFQHVKPGKGAAFVRTKYKNIITGAIRETPATTRPQSSRRLSSSARIMSTATTTATCITSWIRRHSR